jgi:hypothetical protein
MVFAALGAAAFASHVHNGGFYNDDWSFASVSHFHAESGVIGAIRAFDWLTFRPLAMAYWAFTHGAFGTHVSLHLAWIVVMAVAMSTALYVVLRELGLSIAHAAPIAALVLVFPASSANRFFAATSIALPATALFLVGAVLALRHVRTRGARAIAWHVGAVAFYVASVMLYEIAAGAILAIGAVYVWRAGRCAWRSAAWRWALDIAVVGTVLVTITSESWNEPQPFGTAVRHARETARQAGIVFIDAAVPFASPSRTLVAALFAALVATAIVVRFRLADDDDRRRALDHWLRVLGGGAVAVALGYAIFLIADWTYLPLRPGQFNRVNGLAAVGFAILLYALAMLVGLLVGFRFRRWREYSTAVAVALCLVVGIDWTLQINRDARDWATASDVQRHIVDVVVQTVPNRTPGTTLYTLSAPIEVAPGVPTFAAPWDLSGALQLEWDDPSVTAYPGIPGTWLDCRAGSVSAQNGNDVYDPQDGQYGSSVVVDIENARAYWIVDRASCRRAASLFTS